MISSTLGAPLGGTTVGGQYGFERSASRLMTPPNFAGGGGRYLPSIVVVALGEPGAPVDLLSGRRTTGQSRQDDNREGQCADG